jgi:hypothetical protein
MYKYLGITIQVIGKSFSVHIRERLIAAVKCINDIKNLQLLSLKTAIRLFEVKVLPDTDIQTGDHMGPSIG